MPRTSPTWRLTGLVATLAPAEHDPLLKRLEDGAMMLGGRLDREPLGHLGR